MHSHKNNHFLRSDFDNEITEAGVSSVFLFWLGLPTPLVRHSHIYTFNCWRDVLPANDDFYGVQSVLHVISLVPSVNYDIQFTTHTHSHGLYFMWFRIKLTSSVCWHLRCWYPTAMLPNHVMLGNKIVESNT